AHEFLGAAVVVFPGVVEEIDALVDGVAHHGDGLRVGDVFVADVVTADTEEGDVHVRLAEAAVGHAVDGFGGVGAVAQCGSSRGGGNLERGSAVEMHGDVSCSLESPLYGGWGGAMEIRG